MARIAPHAGLIEASGVAPAMGRTFTRDEEHLAASRSVVIISDNEYLAFGTVLGGGIAWKR